MQAGELIEFHGSEGLRLVAERWGDPDARPVLLLHGGGQTRHAWGGTARELASRGWCSYALDMRGHGDSDWHPEGHYQLDNYVADLLSVCQQLPEAPVVVGASLGGLTSLLANETASASAYCGLVLVDITPRLETTGVERILRFMRAHLDGFASIDEAARAVSEYLPERKAMANTSGLMKNLRTHDDGRYYWHWDPRFLDHIGQPSERDVQRFLTGASRLEVPTLIVRGRMSDVVSEDTVREFLALVPHADFVDVSDAGHMVAGDRNDAFTDAVSAFMESL